MLCWRDKDKASTGRAQVIPYVGVADANLTALVVGSERPTFLYFRAACSNSPKRAAGILLRHAMIKAMERKKAADVDVSWATLQQQAFGFKAHAARARQPPTTLAHARVPLCAQVGCACSICKNKEPHSAVLDAMRNATFCPVLNGDTAASLRLTEVILAGCIPVFVGPPWHALPLYRAVDYKSFAVFINVSDTSQ